MNHLLASFPAPVREALAAQDVELARGDRVIEFDAPVARVCFPATAVISGVISLPDAGLREAGLVGLEGLVGFEALWHQPEAIADWVAQVPGTASVVELVRLREAVERWPELVPHVLAFCHAFLAQVMRSAACNATHTAEQRFAKWLLLCHDRVPGDQLVLTHDSVAQLLGMARPRVTLLARTLQAAGILRSSRGLLEIVDRDRLEAASCACYAATRRAYAALLPYVPLRGHPMASLGKVPVGP